MTQGYGRYCKFSTSNRKGQRDILILRYCTVGFKCLNRHLLFCFSTILIHTTIGEATGAVYKMQSKWMDAAIHIAGYHLQSPHYDKIKPPSYSKYHHLNEQLILTRDRERVRASRCDIGTAGKISSGRALLWSIERISTTKSKNRKSNKKKMAAESETRSSIENLGVEEDGGSINVIRTLIKNYPSNRISTRRFEQAPVSGEIRNGDSIAFNANKSDDVREEEYADDDDDDELPPPPPKKKSSSVLI
jgi:hypothetical protein